MTFMGMILQTRTGGAASVARDEYPDRIKRFPVLYIMSVDMKSGFLLGESPM
jgi:hypothetical protein